MCMFWKYNLLSYENKDKKYYSLRPAIDDLFENVQF